MKKYINPAVELIETEAQDLLSVSMPSLTGEFESGDPVLAPEAIAFDDLNSMLQ